MVPKLGTRRLGRLTVRDVRMLREDCRGKDLSERSARYVHATLRAALEDAVREDLLPRNVARLLRLPMPAPAEPRILTFDEARELLKATRDDRLFDALVLLVVLGLRRSEALALRWVDVDLDVRVLQVRQGLHWSEGRLQFLPPKTRRSGERCPCPAS